MMMTITHVYYNPFSVELILCRVPFPGRIAQFCIVWKTNVVVEKRLVFFVRLCQYSKVKYKINKLNQCVGYRLPDVTQSVLLKSRIPRLSPWPLEGRLYYLQFNRSIRITNTIITVFSMLLRKRTVYYRVKQGQY